MISAEVHAWGVEMELRAAGFSPQEREIFFGAWGRDVGDLNGCELDLLYRFDAWREAA